KLGKRKEHVEHQPAHRGGRVDLLRDADERDLASVEDLHHLAEVEQTAAEAIDLVDDTTVNLPRLNVRQQTLKSRAVHVPAAPSSIIVTIRQAGPAFSCLAPDIGFRAFALGIQSVEFLFQTFL